MTIYPEGFERATGTTEVLIDCLDESCGEKSRGTERAEHCPKCGSKNIRKTSLHSSEK